MIGFLEEHPIVGVLLLLALMWLGAALSTWLTGVPG